MGNAILEVIATSVTDAIEAQKGGAKRLEVVRDLDRGGLTPSIELVRVIKEAVDLPLRVMVRESEGYAVSGEPEVEKLCAAARNFDELGVDGLVMGFLRNGSIDVDLTTRVLAAAPRSKVTFHHAFDEAVDQLHALTQLKKLSQVDRILSSGGSGEWELRQQRIGHYACVATPEITIIAGGGIDVAAISLVKRTTTISEFHVGRAARRGFQVTGEVQAELVRELVEATKDNEDPG